MARIKLSKGKQKVLIEKILASSNLTCEEIANEVDLSARTIRAWRSEEHLADYDVILYLCEKYEVKLPSNGKKLEEHWWFNREKAKELAEIRLKKYGPPGTFEGRRKGGRVSCERRKKNPELVGNWVMAKKIATSPKCKKLSEFIGILLGDGSISNGQCGIYLNSIRDKDYILYVSNLIKSMFALKPKLIKRKKSNCVLVLVSSVNLVRFLKHSGLKEGNKVVNQVSVPGWIENNENYSKACIRGLFDTDGCVFNHKYKVGNNVYKYTKMNFTNKSKPLLTFVKNKLKKYGFTPKLKMPKRVWLHNHEEVYKYFDIIGSSNPRLWRSVPNGKAAPC